MQFGIQVNPYFPGPTGNPWDSTLATTRAAETAGFDSVWLYDHFMWENHPGQPADGPTLECFVGLGALAAVTSRIRLGQLVVGVPYRNPALVAKMATSLDLISHGRSILGLGAAWHRREFEGYGWDFEDVPTRMKRLEEAIKVVLAMWQDAPASFAGHFYRLDRALNLPSSIQRPYPPLMIGGNGEQVTLRLVARYAQWCNVFGEPELVKHRFAVVREHCDRIGRSPDEITYSNHGWVLIGRTEAEAASKLERCRALVPGFFGLAGTPEQLIEHFRAYAAVGAQYCTIQIPDPDTVEAVELFGETVIPALRDA